MEPRDILSDVQRKIAEHAQGDPDKWWYANRFVFARLQLDERKTKVAIKAKLFDAGAKCHGCGEPFASRKNVHLHRLDGKRGYSDDNCVLMHAECHRKLHATRADTAETSDTGGENAITKWSKRYDDKPFLYWWDIAPNGIVDNVDAVEFAKKDTRERCIVPVETLRQFLRPDRQTSRGAGNWGIKVLKDRPDELAFEPGTESREWEFLPVVWLDEAED